MRIRLAALAAIALIGSAGSAAAVPAGTCGAQPPMPQTNLQCIDTEARCECDVAGACRWRFFCIVPWVSNTTQPPVGMVTGVTPPAPRRPIIFGQPLPRNWP